MRVSQFAAMLKTMQPTQFWAVIEPDRPNLQEALAELLRSRGEAEQAAEYRERAEKLKALRARVLGHRSNE